ncbi:helicase associated domain-containing protein, partial [Baffinella frigidus]
MVTLVGIGALTHSERAVASAVVTLVGIGALSNSEKLTPLGQLLIRLPVDVHLGKLILYGVCFGAADEALTMAAALASRSPFLMPMERREQADRSKKRFTLLQSDHLAVLNAYNQFDSLRK